MGEVTVGGSLARLGIADPKTGNSRVFRITGQSSVSEVDNFSWERFEISLNIRFVKNFYLPENLNFRVDHCDVRTSFPRGTGLCHSFTWAWFIRRSVIRWQEKHSSHLNFAHSAGRRGLSMGEEGTVPRDPGHRAGLG